MEVTFLDNPSVNLGQQKGFLLKTGRGTFQRFLWVDGDVSYWVSFLEVVKMPLWDGELIKHPSIFLSSSFSFWPKSFEFLPYGLVGFHPSSQCLVGSFVIFFSGTLPFMAPSLVNPFWAPLFTGQVSFQGSLHLHPSIGLFAPCFQGPFSSFFHCWALAPFYLVPLPLL